MRIAIIYAFLLLAGVVNGQVLRGYRNGEWWVVRMDGQTALSHNCTWLGDFDPTNGMAPFMRDNLYGLVDSMGMEVVPPRYQSVSSMGQGLYECATDKGIVIYEAESDKILLDSITHVEVLNRYYARIERRDSLRELMYLPDRTIFPLTDSSFVVPIRVDLILVRQNWDSTMVVYTDEGREQRYRLDDLRYTMNYVIFREDGANRVVTAKINLKLRNEPHIWIAGDLLSYSDGTYAHLIDTRENKEIISGPYDQIQPSRNGFLVKRNGLTGYMDASGNMKIPIAYQNIQEASDGFIVRNGSLSGKYNRSYQLYIPVAFYEFREAGDFVWHTGVSGLQGLYSLKTKQTLLKPVHDRIVFQSETMLKAYASGNIRILQLDDRHRIVSDVILPNALTVAQRPIPDPNVNFDRRLYELGWFYERRELYDSMGILVKYMYKWGLYDEKDSVVLRPSIETPVFLARQDFSLVPKKRGSDQIPLYEARSFHTALVKYRLNFIEMDTLDCAGRNFVRFQAEKGYGFLLPDEEPHMVSYVSSQYGPYIPYCTGGKRVYCKPKADAVLINTQSLNGKSSHGTSIIDPRTKEHLYHQEFVDGEWNYLDSNGMNLFSTPFSFAGEFENGRAIVKGKNGWGLVDTDTTVIPMIYSSVQPFVIAGKDTLYKVGRRDQGYELMDSLMHHLPQQSSGIVQVDEQFSLLRSGSELLFFDRSELQNRYAFTPSMSALNDGYVLVREQKEYVLMNREGHIIGNFSLKPAKIHFDQLIEAKVQSRRALLNFNGDTLVPPTNADFMVTPSLIWVQGRNEQQVFRKDGTLLIETKEGERLLVDEIADRVVWVKGKNYKVVDAQGQLLQKGKWKHQEELTAVTAGLFFTKRSVLLGDSLVRLTSTFRFEFFEDGYFAHFRDNACTVYKDSLKNEIRKVHVRRIRYHGEGVFSYDSRDEKILFSREYQMGFSARTVIETPMKGGMCLLSDKGKYFFVNDRFLNPFERSFEMAYPFSGNYASVRFKEGWTLINRQGMQLSYPSYGEIKPLGHGLFQAQKKELFGLFDRDGREILPVAYEHIQLMNNGLIQVIRKGEIGYFEANGKPVFEIGE